MTASIEPLPTNFSVSVDPGTRRYGNTLVGGSPARAIRLSRDGLTAWDRLVSDGIGSRSAGALARRLTDAGILHPVPASVPLPAEVTVVVPCHGRAGLLDQCLSALRHDGPTIVVDDGSPDGAAVGAAAERHGAVVLRHRENRGPAAARNTGLAAVKTDLVAFVDSDCEPAGPWLEQLVAHFEDPLVAAVAPRIRPVAASGSPARYAETESCLDLGDRPARVAPGSRVSYVPSTALVVRCAALRQLSPDSRPFDETMRVGEDVDLVWRLDAAGWRVRYEPAVSVSHREPVTWPDLLARRFRYGTSAGALGSRHGRSVAPLAVPALPAAAAVAGLARLPVVAAALVAAGVVSARSRLARLGLPNSAAVAIGFRGMASTGAAFGRAATQLAAPAVIAGLASRSRGRRLAAFALLAAPILDAGIRRRPRLGPARFALAHLADDLAYGAGVWAGAWQSRNIDALTPRVLVTGRAFTRSGSTRTPSPTTTRG